jgi:glycosyltransferase involved in cell wall biosynthesis
LSLTPWDAPARPEVVYVVEQDGACAWYRCRVPASALAALGHRVAFASPKSDVPFAAVTVFLRPSHPDSPRVIAEIVKRGAIAVVDLDDDLWSIARSNPAWGGWNNDGGATLRVLEACIRAASFVTTTTPALASVVRPLNADVRITRNALPRDLWPKVRRRKSKRVVIGWAGSITHFDDLSDLRGVIPTLLDRYPSVRFHVAGADVLPLAEHPRIRCLEAVSTQDYAGLLAGFDIGLAPVREARFNAAKSDLKFIEYAACSVPVVASDGVTYASVEHGVTGFRARSGRDWLRHISRLVEDADLRRSVGDNARRYAESRFADGRTWEKAYGLEEA